MKIFVYGSLRKGMYNHDVYLSQENHFYGYAYVLGTLHEKLGEEYPALVLEGNHKVLGEIYEVDDVLLKDIDELEDFFGEGHEDNEYDRMLVDIYNEEDQIIGQVSAYVYNTKNETYRKFLGAVIESGDFVQHYTDRKGHSVIGDRLIS